MARSKTIRRGIAALAAVAVVAVAGVAPSQAQSVDAPGTELTVTPFIVVPGSDATISQPATSCPTGSTLVAAAWPQGETPVVSGQPSSAVWGAAAAPVDTAGDFLFPVGTTIAPAIYELGTFCQDNLGTWTATPEKTGWITVGNADGTPPSDGTAVVSDAVITWDGTFSIEGAGFAADSEVQCWMYSTPVLLAAWSSSATGAVTGSTVMPAGTDLGEHVLVLAGVEDTGRPRFVTAQVVVEQAAVQQAPTTEPPTAALPAPAPPAPVTATSGDTLPVTGPEGPLALVGVGAVVLGAVLVLASRHRIGA